MAGIGTFLLTPDEAENSVAHALKEGYRLIDTANAYVNEKAVGPCHERNQALTGARSFWRRNCGPLFMSRRMQWKRRWKDWTQIISICS